MSLRDRTYIPLLAAIGTSYLFTAKLGFTMAGVAEQVTAVWPPSGLALAACILFGRRIWPAVWLGAFAANVTSHEPIVVAAAIATGNTLEALTGAWLLERVGRFDPRLEHLRDIFGLVVLAAGVSTTVSALIGTTTLCAAGMQPWSLYGSIWKTWWLGDAMGDLVVAPVVLSWFKTLMRPDWRFRRIAESLVLLAGLITVCHFAFRFPFSEFRTHYPLVYIVFPLLIWAAVRFGQLGTTTATLVASIIAIGSALEGRGPFLGKTVDESLMLVQIFLSVVTVTTLILSAAISERKIAIARRSAEYRVSQAIAHAKSLDETALPVLEAICSTLDWDLGIFWRVDPATKRLVFLQIWNQPEVHTPAFAARSRELLFEEGVGLPGRVWASGCPAWIADVTRDPNFPRAGMAARDGLHGAFAFPIVLDGEVLAVVEFFSCEIRQPDDEVVRSFVSIGNELGQYIGRKRTESALREGEARLRAMLNSALDCIVSMDEEGLICEFNPAAEVTFGYRRAEVLGKNLAEIMIPERHRAAHRAGLMRYLTSAEARMLGKRVQMTAMRRDGAEFPVELTVTVVHRQSRPLFTAYLRDITERKRAEEALRRSEERLRSILDNAPLAVSIKDVEGRYLFLNRTAASLWAQRAPGQEVLGKSDHDLLPAGEAEGARVEDRRVQAAKSPLQLEEVSPSDSSDAKPGYWLTSKFPLVDAAGNPYAICSVSTDITSRREIEEKLKQSDQRKDRFLAMLAHELRNPLAAVLNATEILRLMSPPESRLEWARGVIDRQVSHLARLVDELLDVARITTEKVRIRREPTDLTVVVTRAAESVRPLMETRRQSLSIETPEGEIVVEADLDRLSQVLTNLLDNAAKYTPEGGAIALVVERLDAEKKVLVRVRDTGIGMTPEVLETIFELFSQADHSLDRAAGGLGIGLTLARRLVEMHGGTLEAFSGGPGMGSEFVVTLPLAEETRPEAKPAAAKPKSRPATSRRILIVDDNEDAAESISMMLSLDGHEVRTAYDGPGALEAAGAFRPDVILLDIGLPGMDGYEIARRLKKNGRLDRALLVAVTGYGQEEDRRRAEAAGFDLHLTKPVQPERLRELVNRSRSES
jgi:PAS domain S-box-containing protein